MIQPVHHGVKGAGHGTVGYCGPRYQDHRQVQPSGRLQLGQRAGAARVFGDDMGDGMAAHQGHVGFNCKGATIKDHFGIWHRQGGTRRIDQAQQIEMLGLGGKGGQGLLADGEEYSRRVGRQGSNRRLGIWHMLPVIARLRQPFAAFMGDQRGFGHGAGLNRVAADLGGEGMRCIDDMGDLRVNDVVGKAVYAAIAAKTGWQGLRHRIFGAPGVGKYGVDAYGCKGMGKGRCLGGATQKEDAHYG